MDVTIAICTWNRSHLLRETLEAMTRMRAAGIEWELLVVDNNCTDDTSQVIASFAQRLPIRGLRESTPGLSAARNTAVAAARGRHIIWTDDDVLVDDAWLVEYARAFARWPDAAVFGGPIEPWFDGEPPRWLRDVFPEVSYAYAACDFGNQELGLRDPDRLPYGANMAFLLSAQREAPYDTRIGVRPSSRVGGEETTAIAAVLQRGY
ncbi:MAG: glycosyltransferase family 2 protein, partial [Acidobacteria bacterium]|nr:glycosyltransferase family 2 protein [Acidobacteriota bacterium]